MTVGCNAARSGGRWCGCYAVVLKAEYEFDARPFTEGNEGLPQVTKAVYEIECLQCGRRLQIERPAFA
jgi:hypothetical protein